MSIVMIRTILLYMLITFALRMMGKRQLGELQPSELVTTILVSNIATLPIEDTSIPLLSGIIPIFTLMCFEVFTSYAVLKSKKLRRIVTGNPVVVIKDGRIRQQELRRLRLNIDDIMTQLRMQNIFDIREVAFAVVETTGSLSVYQKFPARSVTAQMLSLPEKDGGDCPPLVVISDGALIESALRMCNLREEWVRERLKEQELEQKEVFLMTCDRSANYYIVPRDKTKKNPGESDEI